LTKCQDPSLHRLRSRSPVTGPQVSGCCQNLVLSSCVWGPFPIASPGSPSLVCREKNGPGAWASSTPPGRCVSDKSARCAVAPRREMARILLEVSVNTGRPHPRLLFRESCDRAVPCPREYGSGAQRTSDYGDLIKGLMECQP
jgi:hypothetical protein